LKSEAQETVTAIRGERKEKKGKKIIPFYTFFFTMEGENKFVKEKKRDQSGISKSSPRPCAWGGKKGGTRLNLLCG